MKDWILLKHALGNIDILKNEIREASNNGENYITLLIETNNNSFATVTASYYNDFGDELFMLDHNSCNFCLDDIYRYAILKVHNN